MTKKLRIAAPVRINVLRLCKYLSMKYLKYLLLLLVILTNPAIVLSESGSESVKIGIIVPLTGDMALHGQEIERAMKLALSQAKLKKLSYNYELIFEDNQLNPAKSATAAQRLIGINHVDAVVTLWPPSATVVAPMTERAGILHYTIVWDPAFAKNTKFVLSHQVMVNDIARSSLRLLSNQRMKKVAFFHLEETGFNLGAKFIRDIAPSENIELVADESFEGTETDFRSIIERTSVKSSDCYLIWSVMPSIDRLIRQIRTRNPSACISGYLDYAEDTSQIQHAPYVSEMSASPDFIKRYSAAYSDPPRSKGANAFDIMNLLISAYESSPAKKLSAQEARNFLTKQKNVDGAVGKFSVNSDGNSIYQPVVRETVGKERRIVNSLSGENKN